MGDIYPAERLKFDLSGEVIVALGIAVIVIILSIYIGIRAKMANPLKKPKGILLLAEIVVEKADTFVSETMGVGFSDFGGLIIGQVTFLALGFLAGLVGLPTPMTNLSIPLSLGLSTFIMIHATSVRFTKIRYFKRYVEPIPLFLPINLISMWAPLLSLSIRLFGNATSGWLIMTLLNTALSSLGAMLFGSVAGTLVGIGVGTPLFHAYFDIVSALIQSLVFMYLTALLCAQERPEDYVG